MPKRLLIHAALSHARIRTGLLAAVLTGSVLVLFPFVTTAAAGDHSAPSQPQNLKVLAVTQTSVTLTWDASTDDIAVAGYNVWVWPSALKRPTKPKTTLVTTYVATGLSCGQSYKVRLTAYDARGNESVDTKALVSTAPCVDTQAPSAPTGLQQIAAGQTSATLSWSKASDDVAVAGYSVSRNGVALGTTSTTSYTFAGLSCGQSYAVGVRAYDVSGNNSPWASFYVATSGCGDQSAPSAPTGLVQTTASTTGMLVAWKASSDNVGVAGYDVFRNGTKLGSTSNLSYALGSLSCGISYSVGVDARDAAGNVSGTTTATMQTSSCPSQPPSPPTSDSQPPTMPSNLALADATPSSMDLTWSPSTDNVGVTGYGVYLDGTLRQTVTGTTYDFVGQACGTSHHLSVEAYDRADNASQRAWVAASTSPCSSGSGAPTDTSPPTTPTNPVILSRTSTSVTVSWAASSDNVGVAGYDGYVDGASAGKTSATTYTFTGLACNTNRTFSIDAYDAAGNTSQKVNVTGSTSACDDTQPPSSPSQLTASNRTATAMTLDWAASTDNKGVAGYDVFMSGTKAMTVTATEATLGNLTCNTPYVLGVQAFDAAGNRSSTSTIASTTAACPAPPPPSQPPPPSGSGKTITVPAGGSWNSCYQQASPGDTCKVSSGSYGGQTLAWRGDLSGKCNRTNTSSLIRFDASSGVTMNGELEVDGPCVAILGGGSLNVKGEVSAFGPDPQHVPDNVLFQGMHSVHIGALASDHITFDSMDVGPATVVQSSGGSCAASEGPGDENKINGRWGASNHTPVDIVISNSALHNQQGRNPDRGSCHYGGLFIVNVNGLLVTNTKFYGNVVYNVQIQNFAGPSPTGIVFDGNSLGCPVDWLDRGAPCDGQKSIQLNTTSTGITGTIKNNRTANGSGGTFGCMVSGCSPSGITLQNNTELADSTSAP